MKLIGYSHKFGDNVSTDLIIPGRFFHLRSNLNELKLHLFEDVYPNFIEKINEGDFIVGGKNFGCGSSREHAPTIIKLAGIKAVLAKSFARIFFRNAINLGLLAIEADTDDIESGDKLIIDDEEGYIENERTGKKIGFTLLSPSIKKILLDGGLVEHIKKHKRIIL
ncbi:TPA: 3-isopropylmalate dehydratase [bacterium]|nr:3-isopropylmalate dehydratase [bacterium]